MKAFLRLCLISIIVISLSGCATTHFVKTNPEFAQRKINIKTIGLLLPIGYESNRQSDATKLQTALVSQITNSSPYQLKLVSREVYGGSWDSGIQRVARDSQEILKEIELEGLWKDKKNQTISRKLFDDIKLFKTLDPSLDALLIVKCKQHYGNVWSAGLYAFGAVGGLIAATTAEKDPVIGSHQPADNDTYASLLLVDLNTADILWYNFSLKFGLDITKDKHADIMAKEILYGLLDKE